MDERTSPEQGSAPDAAASGEASVIDVLVEVPMGSRNKYEYEQDTGRFRLDRMLFSAVHFPGDYGFIPETLAEDGDALDALVILGEPTFPGCLISGRVVGVMHMVDEKGPDAKIVAVPDNDPRWRHINTLDDVPGHLVAEIEHFFTIYKDLEQKLVDVQGWGSREEALGEVAASRERHQGA